MNKWEIISLLEHYKLGSGILKSEVKLQGMCQPTAHQIYFMLL